MDGADLVYRKLYAIVPRAVIEKYHHEPWNVVIAAAERKDDGLSVQHGRPMRWFTTGSAAPDDVAFLAQGQGGAWEEKTVLHQQNW